jgi:alanine-alpha-ketoisovalerate/valine-pyruvate aminotransferase
MFLVLKARGQAIQSGKCFCLCLEQSWWHKEQCSERVEDEGRRVREEVGVEVEEEVVTEVEDRMKGWVLNK